MTLYVTASEAEVYALAIARNATHGLQMNDSDKRSAAIRLYADGTGVDKRQIATLLSVNMSSVYRYLDRVDKQLLIDRKAKIFSLWMACCTMEDIAEAVGVTKETVSKEIETLSDLSQCEKSDKVSADFADADFPPPLYNVWPFGAHATRKPIS